MRNFVARGPKPLSVLIFIHLMAMDSDTSRTVLLLRLLERKGMVGQDSGGLSYIDLLHAAGSALGD